MKTVFKKGDKVFDMTFGWGIITDINLNADYPISVKFEKGVIHCFTSDGRFRTNAPKTLSFTEYSLENGGFSQVRTIDWSVFEPNQWFYIEGFFGDNFYYKGVSLPTKAEGTYDYVDIEENLVELNITNIFISEKHCTEFRKCTEEEIKNIYKNFPQLNPKPKWEDFGELEGFYVNSLSDISFYRNISDEGNKNTFPTEKEAKACLALSQLCQWRDKYNGEKLEDWRGWSKDVFKHIIFISYGKIIKGASMDGSRVLTFKTTEIRDKFLKDFKDLIEIAKPLL